MVIKTDELPAAAPADSSREPNSQAGGKGRPGTAGERGRRGGQGDWIRTSGRAGLGFRGDCRFLSAQGSVASLLALHWAAPALKVTFTVAPGCGPGFAHGVPGRAAAAGTRASDRGDTCAHTRFRGAPSRQMDSAAPPPSLPCTGELSGLGSLTLALSGTPPRQDPKRSLCTGFSPASKTALRDLPGLVCGKSAS